MHLVIFRDWGLSLLVVISRSLCGWSFWIWSQIFHLATRLIRNEIKTKWAFCFLWTTNWTILTIRSRTFVLTRLPVLPFYYEKFGRFSHNSSASTHESSHSLLHCPQCSPASYTLIILIQKFILSHPQVFYIFPSYLNLRQGPCQQPAQAVQKHRDIGMMKPIADSHLL